MICPSSCSQACFTIASMLPLVTWPLHKIKKHQHSSCFNTWICMNSTCIRFRCYVLCSRQYWNGHWGAADWSKGKLSQLLLSQFSCSASLELSFNIHKWSSGLEQCFSKCGLWPAASASLGNLLEMQSRGLPRPTDSESAFKSPRWPICPFKFDVAVLTEFWSIQTSLHCFVLLLLSVDLDPD